MIALKTNNKVLELAAGASLSITASNPAFDKDFVDRVFSFPFKIALSPNNLYAVKHFNRFDSKRPSQPTATVYIDNFTVSPGYLNILSVTETEIESTFQNEAINWLSTIKELKIRSLMPVITIPRVVEAHWVLSIQATPPCQYAITINGVQYSHYHVPAGFTEIPAAMAALAALINADYPGVASFPGSFELHPDDTMFPFVVELHTMVNFLPNTFYTYAKRNNFNLQAHITTLESTPVATHCWPVIRNTGFYTIQKNPYYENYINYRHGATKGQNVPRDDKYFKFNYCPQVKVKYVFDRIAEQMGFAWEGDFYNSPEFAALCIYGNYAGDHTLFEGYETGLKYLNGFTETYDLAKQVPDIDAQTFVLRILDILNIYPVIQKKRVVLKKRRDQLKARILNADNAVSPTTIKMQIVTPKGFTMQFKEETSDTYTDATQLEPLVLGAGTTLKEFEARPLSDFQPIIDYLGGAAFRVAALIALGNSEEVDLGVKNTAGFRLFFCWGLHQGESYNYMLGTHLNTDYAGNILGDFSLELDGADGLYQQLHQGWIELGDGAPMECTAALTPGQLTKLFQWTTPIVTFYHRLGVVKAIVKYFEVTAAQNGLSTVKLTMVKL